jgi:ankyrin repeat protein
MLKTNDMSIVLLFILSIHFFQCTSSPPPMIDKLPIIEAAKSGDIIKIDALIKAGADVNQKDSAGKTPLIWASTMGHLETVCLLINYGVAASPTIS